MIYTVYTTRENGDEWGIVYGIAIPTLTNILMMSWWLWVSRAGFRVASCSTSNIFILASACWTRRNKESCVSILMFCKGSRLCKTKSSTKFCPFCVYVLCHDFLWAALKQRLWEWNCRWAFRLRLAWWPHTEVCPGGLQWKEISYPKICWLVNIIFAFHLQSVFLVFLSGGWKANKIAGSRGQEEHVQEDMLHNAESCLVIFPQTNAMEFQTY